MHMLRSCTLMAVVLIFAAAPSWSVDAKKLIGSWSYEKTETNLTGKKPFSMKVFSDWMITFKADGTYSEQSKLGDKKQPDVNGTYQVKSDMIVRSKNAVTMQILVLNEKELVITSAKNTKIFFKKK
jgi:hypothetical protein